MGPTRQAIDRLRLASSEPEPTSAWRLYAIAEGVYVQGKLTKEVTAELSISKQIRWASLADLLARPKHYLELVMG